mgnify:CR=1 FL=1
MDDYSRWRLLANSFPCLGRMVASQRLSADYTPESLGQLCEHVALSTAERSVFSFLLHVWKQYDFSFTLSETRLWDESSRQAFAGWADGRTLGEPLRYF